MAVNIFKFLSLKPFPFDEKKFIDLLKKEINEKIDFIRDDATEGQKTSLCSRAVVSDEDELIDYLEEVLEKLYEANFVKNQATQYFNELYGEFFKQLTLTIENGVLYQEDLDQLTKKYKVDDKVLQELLEYKKNELPSFVLKKERVKIVKEEKKLITEADYKIIKSFFVGGDKPTYRLLCEFFGAKDIFSHNELSRLIKLKTENSNAKLEASSELVLYNLLRKYCLPNMFDMLIESLSIKDIIGLFENRWIKFAADNVLSWNELKVIYVSGIEKGFKPTEITNALTYWCEQKGHFLYIPPEILDARDAIYECPYCGEKYYKAIAVCSKCKLSFQESTYLVDRILKFSRLEGSYKVLKKRHKELLLSFEKIRKYASSDVVDLLNQNERYLWSKNKKIRKIKNTILILFLLIVVGVGLVYFFSYKPFMDKENVEVIRITSQDDFMEIYENEKLNDIYILENDISFFGDSIKPIGSSSNPFTGHFYGNGYTLSNFVIEGESATSLFMYNEGTIENLGLEKVKISSMYHATGFVYENSGTIKNCYVKGLDISTTGNYSYLSSFVYKNSGTITCCYANVEKYESSYVTAGFVAMNEESGVIKDSFTVFDSFTESKIGAFSIINKGETINVYTNKASHYSNFDFSDLTINYVDSNAIDANFYAEKLQWSQLTWDFEDKLPMLKEVDEND